MATPAPTPKPITNGKSPPPPAKAASRLGAIKRGQLRRPLRHLFYGQEGVGKSSLAADAPNPLFLDIEGGSDVLDVARYPFRDEDGGHVPRSYDEVTGAIDDLIANPGHGYETIVIDTIDALEALVHKHVSKRDGKKSIEDFGYGKGYQVALDEFRVFFASLDRLRATGASILLLGHSIVKTFKNPEGEDFDRYQLRVHDKIAGFTKEWCEVVGFVRFEGASAKLKDDAAQTPRARGWETGQRIVHLSRTAAWDAKSRLALPTEFSLDAVHPWRPFAEAKEIANASPNELRASISAELHRICGGDATKEFITSAGTKTSWAKVTEMTTTAEPSTLSRVLSGLKATNPVQES